MTGEMVKFIQFKDPNSEEMKRVLAELPKCPGTCFFIDIARSTDLKYELPVAEWVRRMNNTFSFISFLNDFPENIVKGIGDEIMLYIPDEVLQRKSAYNDYFSLLEEIHATLYNILHFPKEGMFLNCKVGIHYCTEVYNITFFKGNNDYYGIDIDLSARLMTRSKANRIILSEAFYEKVMEDVGRLGISFRTGCLAEISERKEEQFKGVPQPTAYRTIDIK